MPVADLTPIYEAAGREWNVDPVLLQAIAAQESGGTAKPDLARSTKGAQGRMQLMPETAQAMGVTDTSDPEQNIYGGAKYLSQMLDRYKDHPQPVAAALAAYNAGPGRMDRHINQQMPLPDETVKYVPGVAAHYQALHQAAAPQPAAQQQAQADDPFSTALNAAKANQGEQPVQDDPFTSALQNAQQAATPAPSPPPNTTPQPVQPAMQLATSPVQEGFQRGLMDIPDTIATGLNNVAQYVNDRVPALAALDRFTGLDPKAANAAMQAGQADYQKAYGDSTMASIGRVGGQIAGTGPILAGGGALVGTAGNAVRAAAPAATNAVAQLASANMLTRGAVAAGSGALQGGTVAALTSNASDAPLGEQVAQGVVAGGVLGPIASGLGRIGSAATGTTAGLVDPEIARLAQTARTLPYPINVSAPQMSGNSLVKIANDQSSKLPFSGAGAQIGAQQAAFNANIAHEMGETANRITPDVMDRAATRIGGVFNNVAARTNIQADQQLINRLAQTEQEVGQAPVGEGGQAAVRAQIDNVMNAIDPNGTISGSAYQQLTRANAPLSRAMQGADPNVKYYAGQVRSALDDAFQRSAAPEDQAALAQARQQWRTMKTVEDLAEKSTDGNISPALLMGQVRSASSRFDSSTGGMAYTGGGNLGDLARIGQQFMKAPPDSGTAGRIAVNSLVGAGAGGAIAANPLSVAALPAGLVANRVLGGYLRSDGLANSMIRSSLTPGQLGPVTGAGSALLGQVPSIGALPQNRKYIRALQGDLASYAGQR